MKNKCNSVRVNPEMQFTTDDLCRLLFGVGIKSLEYEIKNDTSGKYAELFGEGRELTQCQNQSKQIVRR